MILDDFVIHADVCAESDDLRQQARYCMLAIAPMLSGTALQLVSRQISTASALQWGLG